MPRWIYIVATAVLLSGCDSGVAHHRGGQEGTGAYAEPAVTLKNIAWKYRAGAPVMSSPVLAHEHLYVGSTAGKLVALELETGAPVWEAELDHGIHAPLAAMESRVIVGTDGGLRALSSKGELQWSFDTKAPVDVAPLIWDAVIYFGTRGGVIHAVDAVEGALIWSATTAGAITGEAVRVGNRVAVGSGDGHVYLLDRTSGEPAWTWSANAPVRGVVSAGDALYVAAGTRVSALAIDKPKIQWRFDVGDRVETPPTLWKGNVLIGNSDGQVIALTAADGSQAWRVELGAPPRGPITASGNRVYIPTSRDGINAVSPAGEKVWSFRTDGAVVTAPIPDEGRLYFGDRAGSVYAVE